MALQTDSPCDGQCPGLSPPRSSLSTLPFRTHFRTHQDKESFCIPLKALRVEVCLVNIWKSLLESPLVPGEDQDVFACVEEERAETLSGLYRRVCGHRESQQC